MTLKSVIKKVPAPFGWQLSTLRNDAGGLFSLRYNLCLHTYHPIAIDHITVETLESKFKKGRIEKTERNH